MECGYKEVPNIIIKLYKKDHLPKTYRLETLTSYKELYDSRLGLLVLFQTALIDPDVYSDITSNHYDSIAIIKEMIFRSLETGEDFMYTSLPMQFKDIRLYHCVDYDGDPARWKFKLYGRTRS